MQKRNLSKQKIFDTAIQIIESEGLEGLSMRKLASKLNIEAASLYNHFSSK
jgi:TetR/AcrR family transcriptional regulator, tetracycline repressor protein